MINSGEIKQIARNKLSGNWAKAFSVTAIFVAINLIISYCSVLIRNITTEIPILYHLALIIFALITIPLSFGFISSIVKLLNGKNISYTTIIDDALLNTSKTIGIFFRTFFKMLIPSIIVIFGCISIFFLVTHVLPFNITSLAEYILLIFILYIVAIILIAILSIPYVLSTYALANNNELSSKEALEKSIDLMNGNKWNFVKLMFSFLGWLILVAIIVIGIQKFVPNILKTLIESLGSLAILPYIISSIAVFYDELNDVKIETVDINTDNKTIENSEDSKKN